MTVGDGNSTVDTGAGNDTVTVGNGDNTIDTGEGNDTIALGTGANEVTAGAGADTYTLSGDEVGNEFHGSISDLIADTFSFDQSGFGGVAAFSYFEGDASDDIDVDANMIVLTNEYANVAAVATAVDGDATVTVTDGFVIYFDSTDHYAKLIYSDNLAGNGTEVVIATLTDVTSVSDLADFASSDFSFTP